MPLDGKSLISSLPMKGRKKWGKESRDMNEVVKQ